MAHNNRPHGISLPPLPTSQHLLASCSQDCGGIVCFEHFNLEVEELEHARLLYGEGLGLAPDPGAHGSQRGGPQVVWYNIGR